MSTFYNTTSPTDRDRLRLKIGDTNEQFPIFTNAELDMILDEAGEVALAAAVACRTIAASKARQAISISLPGTTITKTSAPGHYLALADAFEKQAQTLADSDSSSLYTDDARYYDTITGRHDVDFDTPGTED